MDPSEASEDMYVYGDQRKLLHTSTGTSVSSTAVVSTSSLLLYTWFITSFRYSDLVLLAFISKAEHPPRSLLAAFNISSNVALKGPTQIRHRAATNTEAMMTASSGCLNRSI